MKFVIEKNVPMPYAGNGAPTKYPWADMEIGDSFFVPDVPKTFNIYKCVVQFNERHKKSIVVKQRRESNGVRVWRIE